MDILVEQLELKLREWKPEIAERVRRSVLEIIEMADHDAVDILRSRAVEQEVLELLDDDETW